MAQTLIEWTWQTHPKTGLVIPGFTFNPWIGCTEVSPACKLCYARTLDEKRFSKTMDGGTKANPISHWGRGAPRHRTTPDYWKAPLQWNKKAHEAGIALRVFCASLADVFDEEVPDDWRDDLLELIYATPNLDWLILTKRTAKMRDYLTGSQWWINDTPQNVWLGATMERQKEFDERHADLLATPARIHFASMEPLLGPVTITQALNPLGMLAEKCQCCDGDEHGTGLDLVIVGGESNEPDITLSTPTHIDDVEEIKLQCAFHNVPFFFKQWGDWIPESELRRTDSALTKWLTDGAPMRELDRGATQRKCVWNLAKRYTGARLDGQEYRNTPAARLLS